MAIGRPSGYTPPPSRSRSPSEANRYGVDNGFFSPSMSGASLFNTDTTSRGLSIFDIEATFLGMGINESQLATAIEQLRKVSPDLKNITENDIIKIRDKFPEFFDLEIIQPASQTSDLYNPYSGIEGSEIGVFDMDTEQPYPHSPVKAAAIAATTTRPAEQNNQPLLSNGQRYSPEGLDPVVNASDETFIDSELVPTTSRGITVGSECLSILDIKDTLRGLCKTESQLDTAISKLFELSPDPGNITNNDLEKVFNEFPELFDLEIISPSGQASDLYRRSAIGLPYPYSPVEAAAVAATETGTQPLVSSPVQLDHEVGSTQGEDLVDSQGNNLEEMMNDVVEVIHNGQQPVPPEWISDALSIFSPTFLRLGFSENEINKLICNKRKAIYYNDKKFLEYIKNITQLKDTLGFTTEEITKLDHNSLDSIITYMNKPEDKQYLSKKEVVKICKHSGGGDTLTMVIVRWKDLIKLQDHQNNSLTKDDIVAIASQDGASLALDTIASPVWGNLINKRLTKNDIVAIASNNGASQALNTIESLWGELIKKDLTKDDIVAIASHGGASQALNTIESLWGELREKKLTKDDIVAIASNIGGKQALTTVLKIWKDLKILQDSQGNKLTNNDIVAIASNKAGKQALTTVLKIWEDLKMLQDSQGDKLTKDDIVAIASNIGARQSLTTVLAIWEDLKILQDSQGDKLTKDDIVAIASNSIGKLDLTTVLRRWIELSGKGFTKDKIITIASKVKRTKPVKRRNPDNNLSGLDPELVQKAAHKAYEQAIRQASPLDETQSRAKRPRY